MASVPLPHQFAVGEVATADNINTYYSAITYLENPPVASLFQSTPQSIGSGAATPIAFDGSTIDTYSGHSTITNNTRYTFQVAGIYLIAGSIAWSPNTTGVRGAFLRINGTTSIASSQIILPTIAVVGINTNVPCSTLLFSFAVNDYVEILGTQTSGGNLNTNTGGENCSGLNIYWAHV